jgi:tetratricopeptide (TPR) repeat protein
MMRYVVLLLVCLMMGTQTLAGTGGIVSELTYKRLSRVHKFMDDEKYDLALERLKGIRPSNKWPYEQALVRQTFGYLYAAKGEYPKAIDAFVQCLVLQRLPESATKNILYTLAQLQISVSDYPAAIDSLERWYKLEKTPTPQAHAFAGTVYALAKRYTKAIEHLQKAIASADDPKEDWYRQLLAVNYTVADYRSAARLLEQMTRRFSERKAYWLQLSSVFRTLKDDARSLAVMELAYRRGLLNNERELTELAGYYLYMDMPYKAGELLETALENGSLSSTNRHWQLLSEAWLRAREMRRAMQALQRASEQIQEPALFLRLAQLAAHMDEWSVTLHAVDRALHLEGLKQPGKAYILKGMAHFNRGEYNAAQGAFEHARENKAVQDQAQKWLDHLTSEMAVGSTGSAAY